MPFTAAASVLQLLGLVAFFAGWLSYDHYRPWVNFHAEALVVASVGLMGLGLAASRPAKTFTISAPVWIGWLLILALLPWMQWGVGWALFAGDALLVSLYICAFSMAVAIAHSYAHDEWPMSGITVVFFSVWGVAILSAAIGITQWMGVQGPIGMYVVQTDFGDRAMGNLGQPNQLATLMLMGLACSAWIYERRYIHGVGLVFSAGFLSLALVASQSRAGLVSALAVAPYLIWKVLSRGLRVRHWHITLWMVFYLGALQCLPWVHDLLLMSDVRDMSVTRDPGRIVIWKQVWAGILESPWLGYGWNQTPTAHAAGALTIRGDQTFTNAHNVVLDLMAWAGIPIGLMVTIACAYWMVSRILAASHRDGIYAVAAILPVALHSLVEYPFAYAYFLLTVGLFVGVVEARHPAGGLVVKVSRFAFAVFIALWLIVGCRIVYEYLQVEEDFRVVRFENLRIGRTSEEYRPPDDIRLLSQLGIMLKASRLRPVRNMNASDIEVLRAASLRFSYGALALRYALALGLNGQPSAASVQMQVIRGMYGEFYYQAAVDLLRAMERESYPELKEVFTP